MNCLLYQLKCCFGPFGCSCFCISPVRSSIATRAMYSLMLVLVSSLCILIHERNFLESIIKKVNLNVNGTCYIMFAEESCVRLLGYKAIYRIAYSFSAFHILMTILCIQVSSSQVWRAKIHNGFWFFKIIVVVGFWIILFIFRDVEYYMTAATIIGVAAALIFIIIQDVSLIDCAYEFNGYLREKGSKNCCYNQFLYLATLCLYMLSMGGYIFLYFSFAFYKICMRNRVLIIVNASASFVIVLFSFLIGKHYKNKLYIPGALTCLFVTFITWTAISSAPYEMVALSYKPNNSQEARMVIPYNMKNNIYRCRADYKFYDYEFGKHVDTYCGIFLMLGTALYCCIKSTIESQRYGIKPAKSKNFSINHLPTTSNEMEMKEIKFKHRTSGSHLMCQSGDNNNLIHKTLSMPASINVSSNKKTVSMSSQDVTSSFDSVDKQFVKKKKSSKLQVIEAIKEVPSNDEFPKNDFSQYPIDLFLIHDEHYFVRYSYSWLHFIFALAYLFVMVQLTNWYSPQTSHIHKFDKSLPSMWMKITTSWIALGLYSWTLLFPAFCIGRKLYEDPLGSLNRYRNQVKLSKSKKLPKKDICA